MDSASRQLVREFAIWQVESQIQLKHKLDQEAKELQAAHEEALEYAAAKHAEVLAGAEKARQTLELQIENEKRRRAQMMDDELEQARREKVALLAAEKQRLVEEALQKEKEAEAIREKERAAADAQMRAQEHHTNLENERKQRKDAAEQRMKEEEEQQAALAAANAPPPPNPLLPMQRIEAEHQEYLALHKKLKEMRKNMLSEHRKRKNSPGTSAAFKQMTDSRRLVTKTLGQIMDDMEKNGVLVSRLDLGACASN